LRRLSTIIQGNLYNTNNILAYNTKAKLNFFAKMLDTGHLSCYNAITMTRVELRFQLREEEGVLGAIPKQRSLLLVNG